MTINPGLCGSCEWSRRVNSHRGSVFWLCRAATFRSDLRKYPPLPVLECEVWKPLRPAESTDGEEETEVR